MAYNSFSKAIFAVVVVTGSGNIFVFQEVVILSSNDSKTKQGGLNRAFPLSTFSLMCCYLKVRPSFPFCACVHTKICQKGKFVQTKVFDNTLFLKIEVA